MRPGLVIIGLILLLLAAGTIFVAMVVPAATSANTVTYPISQLVVNPNTTGSQWVPGINSSYGTLEFRWQSSNPFNVSLFWAGSCQLTDLKCVHGNRVAHWPSSTSGDYKFAGKLVFPCLVEFGEVGKTSGSFSASISSSAQMSVPLPLLTMVVILSGGVVLAVLGGLGLFLGLFLRGSVYGPRPPRVSQSADDVGLLDDEFDDEPH